MATEARRSRPAGAVRGIGTTLGNAAKALRNRDLARLLTSFGLWVTGDWAFLIALSVVAYDSGGAAAVGLVGAVRVLPAAVFSPLASVVADRLPRPRVLAGVHAILCLVALGLAGLMAGDVPLAVVLVVVGVGAALTAVFKPCLNALLPQLVRNPGELVAANSAYSTMEAAGTVAGPVASGLLLAVLGPPVTFLALAALFVIAAGVSITIHSEFQPARSRRVAGWSVVVEPFRGFPVLIGTPGMRLATEGNDVKNCSGSDRPAR